MIGQLTGEVLTKEASKLVLNVGGVGFDIFVSQPATDATHESETVTLFIHMVVRDDRFELYGFLKQAEKYFFEQLIKVRDVGPKSALAILSLGNLAEVQQSIINGDTKVLTSVSGIGKKTAERIILELKEKVFPSEGGTLSVPQQQSGAIVSALTNLGYSAREAKDAIKDMPKELQNDDERLRWVLSHMGS